MFLRFFFKRSGNALKISTENLSENLNWKTCCVFWLWLCFDFYSIFSLVPTGVVIMFFIPEIISFISLAREMLSNWWNWLLGKSHFTAFWNDLNQDIGVDNKSSYINVILNVNPFRLWYRGVLGQEFRCPNVHRVPYPISFAFPLIPCRKSTCNFVFSHVKNGSHFLLFFTKIVKIPIMLK